MGVRLDPTTKALIDFLSTGKPIPRKLLDRIVPDEAQHFKWEIGSDMVMPGYVRVGCGLVRAPAGEYVNRGGGITFVD